MTPTPARLQIVKMAADLARLSVLVAAERENTALTNALDEAGRQLLKAASFLKTADATPSPLPPKPRPA